MHSTVLGYATGYSLLLSSFVTFVMLLRERYKNQKKSSFYILSMSDVFSTVLTAVVLLVSHVEIGMKLDYNSQNNINDTWTMIEDEDKKHRFPFTRIRNLYKTASEIDLNVTLTCDTRDMLTQYGLLFAPLTNAFVSLLTFAVQCNADAMRMKRKCSSTMKSSVSDSQCESKQHAEIAYWKKGTAEDEQHRQQTRIDNAKSTCGVIRRITKALQPPPPRVLRKNEKPISFLVTIHWLAPFLVVGTLYFAEYGDTAATRDAESIECAFQSNFPMNDFSVFSDNRDKTFNSSMYTTSLGNDYFINEDSSNELNSTNSTEVNLIISKVQEIVLGVINYIKNSTEDTRTMNLPASDGFGHLDRQDAMEYILTDNTTHVENNTSIDSVIQGINEYAVIERYNASEELGATTFGIFSDVSTQATNDDSYLEDAQIYSASAEKNTAQTTIGTPPRKNATFTSNNQIYADIVRRIQAANAYVAVQNHNHSINSYYQRKQPKRSKVNSYVAQIKSGSIKDLFLIKNDDFNHDITAERRSGSLHMTNKCLVSIEFLKLHLFILFFAIYFLPILLCSILQVRGKKMCENMRATLKKKIDLISISPGTSDTNLNGNNAAIVNESPHLERLSTSEKAICHSIEEVNTPRETRDDHSSITDLETISKDLKSHERQELQDENIFLQVNRIVKIFQTIKISLISCIVLWTPIFLEILLRVFLCIHAPQWLIDATFLSAISFGTIRNFYNMYIVKVEECCDNGNIKENRIHPIE